MEGRKQDAIRLRLTDMLDLERQIADGLARRIDRLSADRETASALQRFHAVVHTHAEALAQHLKQYGGQMASPKAPAPWPSVSDQADAIRSVSIVLRECYLAFTHAAGAYGALFETALRLYLPPLRALSTKHLKAHVIAAHTTNELAVRAVASELEENGLHCACVCPMCGMGACACVATGAGALAMAWQEASAQAGVAEGFPLQRPRPHSELAAADVHAEDRIVTVDGQSVRSVPEIQELVVKHVSDNPPS